jgi:hypothetical protein
MTDSMRWWEMSCGLSSRARLGGNSSGAWRMAGDRESGGDG